MINCGKCAEQGAHRWFPGTCMGSPSTQAGLLSVYGSQRCTGQPKLTVVYTSVAEGLLQQQQEVHKQTATARVTIKEVGGNPNTETRRSPHVSHVE